MIKYLFIMTMHPSYEPDDKFLVVMEPFLQEATKSFEKMQKTKTEMEE